MTESTRFSSIPLTYSLYLFKKCYNSTLNICLMVSSSNSVYPRILKCLTSLLVIKVLPPPGGPIAANIITSSNFINYKSFLLYHPLWSRYYLNNSIGGYAPYSSFLGIFKSSTKKIYFFPIGGPNTPFLLLSIFESIVS